MTQDCWNDSRTQERGWLPLPVTPEGTGSPPLCTEGLQVSELSQENSLHVVGSPINPLSSGSKLSHKLGHNADALKLDFSTTCPNTPTCNPLFSPSKAGPAPSRSRVHPRPCSAQALWQLHPMDRDQQSLLHALFLSSLAVNLGYNSLSTETEAETGHCPVWSCWPP